MITRPVTDPADIVDAIRYGQTASPASVVNPETTPPRDVASVSSPEPSTSTETDSTTQPGDDLAAAQLAQLTTYERATQVITNDRISLNARLAVFTVVGSSDPRLVKLHPAESCSCPARSNCYHIVAARLAVGVVPEDKRRRLNLTQLRKKTKGNALIRRVGVSVHAPMMST